MKKITPIVLILLFLGAASYYFMSRKNPGQPQSVVTQVKEATEWAAAIASGKPTTCVMTKGEEKMDYLIKGKKMKATMVTLVGSKKITSYLLNDEQYLYMWQDGQSQGTKMTIPSEEETKKMADQAKEKAKNIPDTPNFNESGFDNLKTQGYTINCNSSNASDSDFVPPQNIKFQDLSTLTRTVPSANPNGTYDAKALEEMAKKYGASVPSAGE